MNQTRRGIVNLLGAPVALAGLDPAAAGEARSGLGFERGSGAVSVVDFGARCDRAHDDTTAVQAAIDHCAQSRRWRDLCVPGGCRITRPLRIDRPVDTMIGEFRIFGGGDGGGFYVDSPLTLFDSALAVTSAPQSEHIGFYNIQFEAADPEVAAFVLSAKFLRVAFNNCYFHQIKAYASPIYVQSFRFRNCRATRWKGVFAKSAGAYDVVFETNAFEAGGALFASDRGSGLRFANNLFEGSAGPCVRLSAANGVYIAGNYTEANAKPDYILAGAGGAISRGVVMLGNMMALSRANAADPAFWNVVVGDCRGLFGAGNYCSGRLFDDSTTVVGNLTSAGDAALVALNKSGAAIGLQGVRALERTENTGPPLAAVDGLDPNIGS